MYWLHTGAIEAEVSKSDYIRSVSDLIASWKSKYRILRTILEKNSNRLPELASKRTKENIFFINDNPFEGGISEAVKLL